MEHKYNLKYSKRLDDPMTLKEKEIWFSQEVAISTNPSTFGRTGKTLQETMKELNVGHAAIARTKRKPDYNAATKDMFEKKTEGAVEEYVNNILTLTKATKGVNIRVASKVKGEIKGSAMVIERIQEPENTVRFNATCKIGDALGVDAPKQVDLKHTLAAMGDDELQAEIDRSVQEIEENGRKRRAIAGAFSPSTVVTSTATFEESPVEGGGREPAVCETDS